VRHRALWAAALRCTEGEPPRSGYMPPTSRPGHLVGASGVWGCVTQRPTAPGAAPAGGSPDRGSGLSGIGSGVFGHWGFGQLEPGPFAPHRSIKPKKSTVLDQPRLSHTAHMALTFLACGYASIPSSAAVKYLPSSHGLHSFSQLSDDQSIKNRTRMRILKRPRRFEAASNSASDPTSTGRTARRRGSRNGIRAYA